MRQNPSASAGASYGDFRGLTVSPLRISKLPILLGFGELLTTPSTHRVRSICSRVLRYARVAERQCRDVAADLIRLLVPAEPEKKG